MTRDIQFDRFVHTGQFVSDSHFGGNIVGRRNESDGRPTSGYENAVSDLGITTHRYPGGAVEPQYSDGILENGRLPEHLTNFMDWVVENNQRAVLVMPVIESLPSFEDVQNFTAMVMANYSDYITAFELGNEHWTYISETEYSSAAGMVAEAIASGASGSGVTPEIWIQAANPASAETDFGPEYGGWIDRNIDANRAIIDGLSVEAQSVITGLVEHYYFKDEHQYIGEVSDAAELLELEQNLWESALGHDLSLNITEWNITQRNLYQLGMRSATTMLAQFQYMIDVGVDEAYVWPPHHNTRNDLAGSGDEILTDPVTGLVINSVGGAIFSYMERTLPGLESLATNFLGASSEIETRVYASSDTWIFFVGSRSETTEDVSVDFSSYINGFYLDSAIRFGYDHSTADGTFHAGDSFGWQSPDSAIIDGNTYYFNEHDANAEVSLISDFNNSSTSDFNFELDPYEVMAFAFSRDAESNILGIDPSVHPNTNLESRTISVEHAPSGGDESVNPQEDGHEVFGDDDRNHLIGGAGDDFIYGMLGNDTLMGGAGNDYIEGSEGNDRIDGGTGRDTLLGGDGRDYIVGGESDADLSDNIFAGRGNDQVYGGYGNDVIYGDQGSDSLFGQEGSDSVVGNAGDDILSGGSLSDYLVGGNGDDFLNGGFGFDQLNGGDGADTFFRANSVGHGSDWIQDFDSVEGDLLHFDAVPTNLNFHLSTGYTPDAGSSEIAEIFVSNRDTGEIFWALVDGDQNSEINISFSDGSVETFFV